MSRKVIGLDIRLSSVSVVMLENTFKGSILASWQSIPISSDKPREEGLADALQAVVKDLNPANAVCVLGISTQPMSFRHLTLPFHDPKKIRQVLPFELESDLPVPLDELFFDVEAVKGEDHHNLLVFMVPKDDIHRNQEQLNAVHLRPVVITPSAYATLRCLLMADADLEGDGFFVDTESGYHCVYAVHSGKVRLVRTFPAGNDPEAVLSQLKIGLDRIRMSAQDGLGLDFNPVWIISGGPDAACLRPDESASTDVLGMPIRSTAMIRTFPKLTGKTDTPEWLSGKLDTALALALMEAEGIGGINFSTERTSIQHYWTEYRESIIFSAVLFTIMLITLLTTQIMMVSGKERRVAELDRQIEAIFRNTLPDVTQVVNPLHQMKVKLKEIESGTGTDASANTVKVIDLLNAVSQQIPGSVNVKISRLVMGTDNVVLTGDTDTFNTVNDIKGKLDKASIFKAVTISSADLDKGGQRVRFRLKLDF